MINPDNRITRRVFVKRTVGTTLAYGAASLILSNQAVAAPSANFSVGWSTGGSSGEVSGDTSGAHGSANASTPYVSGKGSFSIKWSDITEWFSNWFSND